MDALLSAVSPKEGPWLSDAAFFRACFRRLPRLETERLVLRRVRRSDAGDLYDYAQDPEVSRHVLWTAHRSLADSREFLSQLCRQYRKGLPASFGIEEKETGRLIGTIGFMSLSPENRCAEVGYSLARSRWNRGIMTEALNAVLGYAFETLLLNRVEAIHETDNPASGRVMEKAGMRPEGTLRAKVYNKGRFTDVRIWAVLKKDWLAAHQSRQEEDDVHI